MAALTAGLALLVGSSAVTATPASAAGGWQVAWTAPTDLSLGSTLNSTVRDIATVPIGASSVSFTFSNLWSPTPTTFAAVTVGVTQSGVDVVPGSFRPVTFRGGSRSVVIAPGGQVTSDPVAMSVHAGESLSVSIAVSGWAAVSAHTCCDGRIDTWATSNGVGNLTLSPTGAQFNRLLTGSYIRWLSGISVAGSASTGSIVAFGDSITDGYGYTNVGFSWVDALQRRFSMLPPAQQMPVVNEGIAGNTMAAFPPNTTYATKSGGVAGETRFANDALAWPGVKDVLLLLGTNDIWFGAGGETVKPIPPYGTPLSIEGAMRNVVNQAHARGVKIYGITLLPRATSTAADHDQAEYWGPHEQAILSAVNTWMLSGAGGFDGVIDLAAVMGDVYNGACDPTTPFAPYFNPDHLHPNVAGETVMGNAISTTIFGMAQAPQLSPPVTVTPTAGCAAAQRARAVLAASTAPGTTTTTSTTTTIPTTTTTKAPVGLLKRVGSSMYLWAALALTILFAIWNARRRQLRRRAEARRRAIRLANYPRMPPPAPPRNPSTPGSAPRRPPPRR